MNRFHFPQKKIARAILFIKNKKGTAPGFIQQFPGVFNVRRGKLYAGNRRVIPAEEREDFLREIVYGKKSEYPFGRDSLFAILKDDEARYRVLLECPRPTRAPSCQAAKTKT